MNSQPTVRRACGALFSAGVALLSLAGPARAQQEVTLGIRGYVDEAINLAIDDLEPASAAARTVAEILAFDLEYSLRFNVIGRNPGVVRRAAIDYEAWSIFGTEYLLTGQIQPTGAGFRADLAVHHVPFQRRIRDLAFSLPSDPSAPGFRAAVHDVSNRIIRELTGEEGIADTRIAFASRRRGDKEIYTIDYDGHGASRVTSLDTISMTPDWHPGGGEICFTTFVTGDPDLYCAPAGGGRARAMSRNKGLDMAPAWSPDGRLLAMTLTKDGNAEIYVLDAGGRSLGRLTYSLGIDTAPSWSPNGRQIVFESDRTGRSQIYTMDAEGASVRQITFGGEAHSPAWSPLGDRIAYVERIGGRFQIATIGVDGGGRTVLTSIGDNEDPSWSPDGLHIAFSSSRGGGSDIYTMDWDGANVRQTTRGGAYVSPGWSPRLRSGGR